MPKTHLRTFADDTAALLHSWKGQGKQINTIMTTSSSITAMDININKTKNIPLWDEPLQSIIDRMKLPCNSELPEYTWATSGKYLGFMIGPGSPQESWLAPTTKFNQRLTEWPWPTLGLFLSMRIYNTFILPTLLFKAQLEHPPKPTLQAENRAQKAIAAGPKGWCRMQDIQHLKDIGSPIEARSLEFNTVAAMLRTAFWENTAEGGIPWAVMHHHHQHALRHSEFTLRAARQADWH